MDYRIERDSLGEVAVPADKYWGPQTERSRHNFRIGPEASMPREIIHALACLKKAAALANHELGVLDRDRSDLIVRACDEILEGRLDDQFPLVIWQTGSGTQSNMNVNEVIANRAHVLAGGRLTDGVRRLHPNDDVNRSQSSNDAFPTATHIATFRLVSDVTLPGLERLRNVLAGKSRAFMRVVKIGRTHLMDAVPLTLGQELSGYVRQLDNGIRAVRSALDMVKELALGGTAVGTGMNAPQGFAERAVRQIADLTGLPFVCAPNAFEALAARDAMVELSSALKRAAVSLMKIGNDLRLLASGPRGGIGEVLLPANEPGSSIMPGKVNPTQVEALTMVCAQVIGNDVAVTVGGAGGQLELNTFGPMIAANVLQSARLLGEACASFSDRCAEGLQPNLPVLRTHLEQSLMLVTALSPYIGYERAAEVAWKAHDEGLTLREAALSLRYVTAEEFDAWVDPAKMVGRLPED